MVEGSADPEARCPVDPKTRERWLEAAKAQGQHTPAHPELIRTATSLPTTILPPIAAKRWSLDTGTWTSNIPLPMTTTKTKSTTQTTSTTIKQPRIYRLSTDREISTIPRAQPSDYDQRSLNSAEKAALPPSNSEQDTGHDRESGNWIYPSQKMFFSAMKRKGHDASNSDMASIVPIHNAVNEKAWTEIKAWEKGRGSEKCGGPKLVSFAGDSKALTPRARWNGILGYSTPFDRHDWVVDRCGKRIDYVIDFYSGKDGGLMGKSLNFYLDVRPKLNTWDGIKTRALRAVGM